MWHCSYHDILTKRLPEKPAHARWFEDGKRDYITANRVSQAIEALRVNMLRSLSTITAELQNLEFDKIGMPRFTKALHSGEEPTVTHTYRWNSLDEDHDENDALRAQDQVYRHSPFRSSTAHMTAKLEQE
jgi:hypothetical protein